VIVALELIFSRVTVPRAITEARDHCVSPVEEHLGLERGRNAEEGDDRTDVRRATSRWCAASSASGAASLFALANGSPGATRPGVVRDAAASVRAHRSSGGTRSRRLQVSSSSIAGI
jgi:hypothetical protein